MKIIIKTKHIELSEALRDWINKKLEPLAKFEKIFQEGYHDHFFGKGKPRVELWLEVGKTTRHHRKGPFFFAEAQMRFPKKSIRSEAFSKNLRQAITEVKDELQREIKEYREKIRARYKRGAREFKREIKVAEGAKAKRKKGERIREEGL